MITKIITFIVVAGMIFFGVRSILRQLGNKLSDDQKQSDLQHKQNLQRNREMAKSAAVVELERGEDGVYRPNNRK